MQTHYTLLVVIQLGRAWLLALRFSPEKSGFAWVDTDRNS